MSHLHWDRVFKIVAFNYLFFSIMLNDVSNTIYNEQKQKQGTLDKLMQLYKTENETTTTTKWAAPF